MATFDIIANNTGNFKGYTGNPPTSKAEYDALDCWVDKSKAPSWASISTDIDNENVRKTRKPLYPPIGDQLDDLYKKGAFSTEMAAKIKKVKDDNPKG